MQETQEMQVRSLYGGDPVNEGMATHSSILAWEIPGTEEPGPRGHKQSDTAEHTHTHTHTELPARSVKGQ